MLIGIYLNDKIQKLLVIRLFERNLRYYLDLNYCINHFSVKTA